MSAFGIYKNCKTLCQCPECKKRDNGCSPCMDCTGEEYDSKSIRQISSIEYFLNFMRRCTQVHLSLKDYPCIMALPPEIIEPAIVAYCDKLKEKKIDGGYRLDCMEFLSGRDKL